MTFDHNIIPSSHFDHCLAYNECYVFKYIYILIHNIHPKRENVLKPDILQI